VLFLQDPEVEGSTTTGENRLSEAVVGDANVEGGRGGVRIDPEDGKNAVNIAEKQRRRTAELVPCRA
jgi:hypothetical protein